MGANQAILGQPDLQAPWTAAHIINQLVKRTLPGAVIASGSPWPLTLARACMLLAHSLCLIARAFNTDTAAVAVFALCVLPPNPAAEWGMKLISARDGVGEDGWQLRRLEPEDRQHLTVLQLAGTSLKLGPVLTHVLDTGCHRGLKQGVVDPVFEV